MGKTISASDGIVGMVIRWAYITLNLRFRDIYMFWDPLCHFKRLKTGTPLVRKTISAPDGIVGPVEEGLQQVVASVARQQQARVLIITNFRVKFFCFPLNN